MTAQVNPHFLFNTLNTIYALAATEEALQTTEAILKLAEIMRYPLNEGKGGLWEKIDKCENDIKLINDKIYNIITNYEKLNSNNEFIINNVTGGKN